MDNRTVLKKLASIITVLLKLLDPLNKHCRQVILAYYIHMTYMV